MNPIFLLSGTGMILVAILSIVYWRKKTQVAFSFFLLGAFAWIMAIILKGIAALPKDFIVKGLKDTLPVYLSEPLAWIYIGILTGVFECGTILLFLYAFKRLQRQTWNEAVGFGLGFGAFEALLVGIGASIITLLAILAPDQLPKELEGPSQLNTPIVIPASILERVSTIFVHTFSSVLIVFSLRTKEWKWFWLSFLYKTMVDSITGAFHISYGYKNFTVATLYIMETLVAIMATVGILGLRAMRKKWTEKFGIEQI